MHRHATILGRLGSTPDTRTTDSGTTIATVSVATETYHDDGTVWVTVTAFGSTADFLDSYADTGDVLLAEGRPQLDTWDGGAELEVVADTVELIDQASGGRDVPSGDGPDYDESFDDDDVPF